MRKNIIATASFILGAAAIHGPSLAAPSNDASDTPSCDAGQLYDDKQSKCVPANEQSLDDTQLLDNAKTLADA
ncbi:MAG: hypothetical protein AAF940_05355, partial [Pseudomonadota bacterium]